MTRTPFLKPEEMNVEQRRIYDEIVASRGTWLNGPFAPMLHQPRLADPAQRLGNFLRYHTSLAPHLSELAILVVARHWDCDFEWYQHAAIALKQGVSAAVVEAIRQDTVPQSLSEESALVHAFTQQLLKAHRVTDDTYAQSRTAFGVTGVVELTALIGYYSLIAFTLNAHQVPLPAGVDAVLPPRAA